MEVIPIRTVIGIMGGGTADEATTHLAYELGRLIAEQEWVLLNGGRACGVMDASARGARQAGGLTVGILPDMDARAASEYVDVAVVTGLNDARNYVNVLSCHVVIALKGEAGTLSEIALALKSGKRVVLVDFDPGAGFERYRAKGQLVTARDAEDAIRVVKSALGDRA